MTVGEAIKAKKLTRDQVVRLAEGLFDGKRELPITTTLKLKTPALKDLTPHIREMILTALLSADLVEGEGTGK